MQTNLEVRPIHKPCILLYFLFIRWFASASNVLMALSLAIYLARLEGERS
jgi:hypothetical protein